MKAHWAKLVEAAKCGALFARQWGYKAKDVPGIPWTVCPDHGLARPIDFPCKACALEQVNGKR